MLIKKQLFLQTPAIRAAIYLTSAPDSVPGEHQRIALNLLGALLQFGLRVHGQGVLVTGAACFVVCEVCWLHCWRVMANLSFDCSSGCTLMQHSSLISDASSAGPLCLYTYKAQYCTLPAHGELAVVVLHGGWCVMISCFANLQS